MMKMLPLFIAILLLFIILVLFVPDEDLRVILRPISPFVAIGFVYYWYRIKDEDEMDNLYEKFAPKTRELLIDAVKELGCQPKIDDDNAILVNYEGETFRIEADDKYKCITIYDPWWGWLELNNDNAGKLKETVNKCNMGNCIPTMLYTVNGDRIGVHCKLNLNFADKEGRYSDLLAAYFKTFFDAHEMFRNIFDNDIKTEQEKKPRKIIKGFSQDEESNS